MAHDETEKAFDHGHQAAIESAVSFLSKRGDLETARAVAKEYGFQPRGHVCCDGRISGECDECGARW